MNLLEVRELLDDRGDNGIPVGKFEETKMMIERGYQRFAKRYGWDRSKKRFNACGQIPETNIEEYNDRRIFE